MPNAERLAVDLFLRIRSVAAGIRTPNLLLARPTLKRYVLQRVFACLRYFANLCNNSYQPLDGSDTRLIRQDKDEGKRIEGSACEDE